MNGFEFTHHDVLSDMAVRETFENRCKKIMLLADCNLFIFYHHRYCKSADRRLLMQHLLALKKLYLKRCPKVEVVMFTQVIVDDPVERREERSFINGIHTYVFHTTQVWSGNDQNVFWPAEMMICCGK